jgi:hypothetical protein
MRCRTQRMARGRSANLVIPLFLDAIACVTAVTVRPILLQRIWITPSGHEFTKLGRSMYQRLSLADVGVCLHA